MLAVIVNVAMMLIVARTCLYFSRSTTFSAKHALSHTAYGIVQPALGVSLRSAQ